MRLIDFKLDGYDYLALVIGVLFVIAFIYAMIVLGGLPGKMAAKRNHPHADSVKLGGWIGLFTFFPWIHALIWAYHDSLTIDLRKVPKGGGITAGADGQAGGPTPADGMAAAETEEPTHEAGDPGRADESGETEGKA